MCEDSPDARASLPKSLQSPALARDFVEQNICDKHGSRGAVALQLLASELVTNAVLYGAEPITLEMSCSTYSMRVSVHDANKAGDALQAVADGQGLLLVDKIAHEWGTTLTSDGKSVWGTVPTGFLPEQARGSWRAEARSNRRRGTTVA